MSRRRGVPIRWAHRGDARFADPNAKAYYDPGTQPRRVNLAKLSRQTTLKRKPRDHAREAEAAAKRARRAAKRAKITTRAQYDDAMARLNALVEQDPPPDSVAGVDLIALAERVRDYERRHFRLGAQ